MKNSSKNQKRTIGIISALLLISLSGVFTTDWTGVRSVDIVKLLASGILLGILLTQVIHIFYIKLR